MDYEQIATNSIKRALREMAKLSYENAETIKAWADAQNVPSYVTGDDDPAMEAAIIRHWVFWGDVEPEEHAADVWDCVRRAAEAAGDAEVAAEAATMKRLCTLATEFNDTACQNAAQDAVAACEKHADAENAAEALERAAKVARKQAEVLKENAQEQIATAGQLVAKKQENKK